MSQAEDLRRLARAQAGEVTVEDVRELIGPSTPHFALQLRNRVARLIAGLPEDHPARVEGEQQIVRLEQLGASGETRGRAGEDAGRPMPSLSREAPSASSTIQRPRA